MTRSLRAASASSAPEEELSLSGTGTLVMRRLPEMRRVPERPYPTSGVWGVSSSRSHPDLPTDHEASGPETRRSAAFAVARWSGPAANDAAPLPLAQPRLDADDALAVLHAAGERPPGRTLRRVAIALGIGFAVAAGAAGSLAVELSTRPPLAAASRAPRDAFGGAHRLERYDGVEVKVLSAPPPPDRSVRRPGAPPSGRPARRPAHPQPEDLAGRDLLGEALRD